MSSQLADIVDADLAPAMPEEPVREPSVEQPGLFALFGRTLLFGSTPYDSVRDHKTPGRRGLVIILTIIGLVVLAQLIAYWLGSLTAPRLGSLQNLLYNAAVDLPWYAEQTRLDPAFAAQFQQGYIAGWEGLRIVLGYPTVTATASTIVVLIVATLANWLIFSLLAHWTARWYGSRARIGQTLGVVALAYTPLLLRLIEMVPGAVVPFSLLFMLMLATKYLALKRVHGLGPVSTLFVLLAPYVVVAVVSALATLNGGAYAVEQSPYFQQAVQLQQFLGQ